MESPAKKQKTSPNLKNPWDYEFLSENDKLRKDLVLQCFGNIHEGATEMMKHIPDIFKSDIDVVLLLISKYNADRPDLDMETLPNPYDWCDQKLFSNPLFVMNAIKLDFGIMLHVQCTDTENSTLLSDSKPFVMDFIDIFGPNDGYSDVDNPLLWVSPRLCDDPEVILRAADRCSDQHFLLSECISYASKRLRESSEFILKCFDYFDIDEDTLDLSKICPFLWNDINFIKKVVKTYGANYINLFDPYFRTNFNMVQSLMKVDPLIIEFVSKKLQDNLDIVKPEFLICPSDEVMKHASKRVREFIGSMKDLYADHMKDLYADHKRDCKKRSYEIICEKHNAFRNATPI